MTYTTPTIIYARTSLTSDDVESAILTEYILDAAKIINKEINSKVIREQITYLDSVRDNKINGSNKTFYAKKFFGRYFGDMNGDQSVTVDDIIVYKVDSNNEETVVKVTSIDYEDMSFTLETTPTSSDRLFITYVYTYFDVVTPDRLIEMATRYLATAYGYAKVEYALGNNVKVGNIKIDGIGKNSGENKSLNKFEEIMQKIKTYGNSKNTPIKHNVNKIPPIWFKGKDYPNGVINYGNIDGGYSY